MQKQTALSPTNPKLEEVVVEGVMATKVVYQEVDVAEALFATDMFSQGVEVVFSSLLRWVGFAVKEEGVATTIIATDMFSHGVDVDIGLAEGVATTIITMEVVSQEVDAAGA